MPLGEVNWMAALIAALAGFAVGVIWYMALGKQWMAAAGLTEADVKGSSGKPKATPFIIAAIANIVMAAMLFGILVHVGDPTVRRGLMSGLFIWIGFVATTSSVNYAYQQKPFRLTLVDTGHWLVNLMVQGAILGAFG
ncbi:Protein of unknown function [Cohaesibacter sp. ES.047]|uniref:DUF1761 domain-containing protein n=1 Tax=Cohaesibacter sp. ES.047 TaxID=1798205 RepID=UPI000BC00103|nr:DUF1761 domain-containing protein [Cohaesibacter sp. ES.047]SNY90545.1 Protein of unknown function [Cohaesibacter sp. ES.047]